MKGEGDHHGESFGTLVMIFDDLRGSTWKISTPTHDLLLFLFLEVEKHIDYASTITLLFCVVPRLSYDLL